MIDLTGNQCLEGLLVFLEANLAVLEAEVENYKFFKDFLVGFKGSVSF